MKISFVVAAYNEESYLPDCLRSLMAQVSVSPVDTEIIVVDNASTDRTPDIAHSFDGVIVVYESRQGLSYARQAGFEAASGDIIANLDADTRIPAGWITTVITEFERDSGLVGLSGPFIYYDLSVFNNLLVRLFYYCYYGIYLISRFVLRTGSMMQGGNFVVRRSALEKIGGYNLAIPFWGEDSDIAKRIHAIGRVKFTFRLKMPSSGRRLAGEGIVTTGLKYTVNHFSTILFGKPISNKQVDFRE